MAERGPAPTTESTERPAEDRRAGVSGSWEPNEPTPDEIKRWQKFLTAFGFFGGAVTGQWDPGTKGAMKNWQKSVGIPETGRIDDGYSRAKLEEIDTFFRGEERSENPAPAAPAAPTQQGPPAPKPAAPAAAPAGEVAPTAVEDAAAAPAVTSGGAPNPDGKFTIPGGAKVWQTPDGWYAVYTVPGTQVPLAWKIDGDDDLAAIFGPGVTPKADRTLGKDEWGKAGALVFGTSRMLANRSEHPFDAFVANFSTEARIRPWLRDEEILAATTRAILEGRTVTEAELASTDWWQTHTAGERAWIAEYNRDPATAKQKVQDGRDQVRKLLIQSGVSEPPEVLVTWLGDRMTAGTWSQAYTYGQIAKLADPQAPGEMDADIRPLLDNLTLDTLSDNTSKVEQLVRSWLGPAFAAGWTKDMLEAEAGKLRNDPQAEEALINTLRNQRLNLFPEYTDPNATYDTIAAPWRGQFMAQWGEVPDETDPFFSRVVRSNDLTAATQLLRQEGRKRGNAKVVNDTLATIGEQFGGSLRRDA